MTQYTIIGGGIAACYAARAIRQQDPGGRITVVSDEEHCFYYRPKIPLLIDGRKTTKEILFAGLLPEFTLVRDRAEQLDTQARSVVLASGDSLAYDRLLIATGSSAVVPEIKGIGEKHVYFLRTIRNALDLKADARPGRRAVVLGGGLVGVKKAIALAHAGVKVTIVEQLDHLLLPRLDREGAELVSGKLAALGIEMITGATIEEILPGGKGVRLSDSRTLECDLVGVAVGVRANIDWLAGSGLNLEQAVVVDERMETGVENIFAAGDVAQSVDLVSGRPVVSALWTSAVEMGQVAGTNMAGGKAKYSGGLAVMNATEIKGLAMVSAGDTLGAEPGCQVVSRRDAASYRKLVFRGEQLIGAVLVGDIDRAGVYTSLIRSGAPVGALREKMVDGTLSYLDTTLPG